MTVEIKVPTVGESITEVVIAQWLKPAGSWVALDEPIVALETDKVNVEIPAPIAGIIAQVLKDKDATARVGEVIGYIEPSEKLAASGAHTTEQNAVVIAPDGQASVAEVTSKISQKPKAEQRVMPSAQRILAQAGLLPRTATGSGPGGRVLKEDALKLSEGANIPLVYATPPAQAVTTKVAMTVVPTSAAAPVAPPTEVATPAVPNADPRDEVVPMSPLRKRMAQRLVEAQQTAAILTTFNEVDMSAVMKLRKVHQEEFVQRHGVKLGYMGFFIRASIEALRAFPSVNAEIRGNNMVFHRFFDIGVAVGGGKGLVVPIVRDADRLTLAQIEKQLADYAARAKAGTLKLHELIGGTFSISNGGVYGSMMSTPIVNPPQSGILGMHNIIERPIGVNGEIVLRPMMYTALSYDHRIIDGREAVGFLVRLKQTIEAPERLLLDL